MEPVLVMALLGLIMYQHAVIYLLRLLLLLLLLQLQHLLLLPHPYHLFGLLLLLLLLLLRLLLLLLLLFLLLLLLPHLYLVGITVNTVMVTVNATEQPLCATVPLVFRAKVAISRFLLLK
jgi:hypothetical protein